jgi:hypothetical protein
MDQGSPTEGKGMMRIMETIRVQCTGIIREKSLYLRNKFIRYDLPFFLPVL